MSTSTDNLPPGGQDNGTIPYNMNSKIMVAAVIVLFLVVLFILSLHIYAKWFWRHSSTLAARRNASWRRRHRLDFAGQEPFIVAGSVGLDKAIIDSLPVFTYEAPQGEEGFLECAVCLSEFQENEKGRLLPKCNHSFHTECIDMWFHSHSTCPLCRTSARPDVALAIPAAQQEQVASTQASFPLPLPHHFGGLETTLQPGSIDQAELTTETVRDAPQVTQTGGESTSRGDEEALPSQGVQYPTNVLFWGDHSQVSSRLSSPRSGEGRSAATSLPQIAIDIPRRPENFSSPRCPSITASPRCSSTDEQNCSSPNGQPLKSPAGGRLISIKRLLSRERRVFPSEQEGGELDQDATVPPV